MASAAPDPPGTFRPVKSAGRTLDVLEALADGPCSLAELARRLDIPKSSLHGVLHTLTDRGWVRPLDSTRFGLGLRALQVGTAVVVEDPVVAATAATLDRLAAATDETVQHARLDGNSVVYLAKRDSPHPVRLISTVGARLPAHATALGKALLAARDDDTVRRLLGSPLAALTPRTVTRWEDLAADLALVRARGYAVDDGEAADGLRCVAVTVPTPGLPQDAVSISAPVFRMPEERVADIARALLDARAELAPAPKGAHGGAPSRLRTPAR